MNLYKYWSEYGHDGLQTLKASFCKLTELLYLSVLREYDHLELAVALDGSTIATWKWLQSCTAASSQ